MTYFACFHFVTALHQHFIGTTESVATRLARLQQAGLDDFSPIELELRRPDGLQVA